MSINRLKAEKLLHFNDKEYKARMSLDTIIRIEQALGCSILKLGNKLAQADITMTEIISVITLALRAGGNNLQDKEVKVLISEIGLLEAIKMAGELVTLALNVDDDTDEKKKSSRGIDEEAELPYQRWIEVCVGMIGVNPAVFWDMSITEITLAIKGFSEFNGGNKDRPMDKDELNELMELCPDN